MLMICFTRNTQCPWYIDTEPHWNSICFVEAKLTLTARQAILRAIPNIIERISPRSSASKTSPAKPRAFQGFRDWPGFDGLMQDTEKSLDDTNPRYNPVLQAGDPSVGFSYGTAADEAEVRAPLQNVSRLVNHVARDMGINAEITGGGSGRSASAADYLVKLVPAPGQEQATPMPQALLSAAARKKLSKDVLACIEVKGEWQVRGPYPLLRCSLFTSVARGPLDRPSLFLDT